MTKPLFPYKHGDVPSGNWTWALGAQAPHGSNRPLCVATINFHGAKAAGYDCEELAKTLAAAVTPNPQQVGSLRVETQARSFCVEIPDVDKFLELSEGTALDDALDEAGAFKIEANGHYGSAYYFSLSEEDVPRLAEFVAVIERHIAA